MRDWIVETSQEAHNWAYARRGEGDAWPVRFIVGDYRVEDSNEGMILVRESSNAKRWMLVGRGRSEMEVGVGFVVGIKEPTWGVLVGHDLYTVAIEWKVLNG